MTPKPHDAVHTSSVATRSGVQLTWRGSCVAWRKAKRRVCEVYVNQWLCCRRPLSDLSLKSARVSPKPGQEHTGTNRHYQQHQRTACSATHPPHQNREARIVLEALLTRHHQPRLAVHLRAALLQRHRERLHRPAHTRALRDAAAGRSDLPQLIGKRHSRFTHAATRLHCKRTARGPLGPS